MAQKYQVGDTVLVKVKIYSAQDFGHGPHYKVAGGWTSEDNITELVERPDTARTIRKHYTCPRCNKWVESEITAWSGYTVCPACENEICVSV